MKNIYWVLVILCFAFYWGEYLPVEDLDRYRVEYQDQQGAVDLGVGLWAWPMPLDYDNDGDLDLVVSCPDVPFNGTYFFENPTGDVFPKFKPPVKIGSGHKNIQVSYVDKEPRITVGPKEIKNFREKQFAEVSDLFELENLKEKHQKNRFMQSKWVDYEGDGDMDLIVGVDDWGDYGWDNAFDDEGHWTNGPLHGFVYLFENDGDRLNLRGKIEAGGRAIDVYGAPSPSFADFDGDGDLDIICGEFIDKFSWFENVGSRREPIYAEGRYLSNEDGILKMDLQMIIPTAIDWDADGDMDLIVGDEDGRVAWIEHSGEVEDGMPIFRSPVYFQQEPDKLKFGALITPVSTDWDGDGDEDIIAGNTAGYIGFFENTNDANPPSFAPPVRLNGSNQPIRIQAGASGSIQGPCEAKWGYTTISVADWDGDQLDDIVLNSIWGKIMWCRNIGTSGNPALADPQPIKMAWDGDIPKPKWTWWKPGNDELATQWRTTPVAVDWNEDGLTDLVMLDQEGYLSFYERFEQDGSLLLKPGQRVFKAITTSTYKNRHQVVDSTGGLLRLNVSDNGSSGRRKLCLVDWDGDSDLDLLVNSRNVSLMENVRTEDGFTYFTDRGELTDVKLAGHTTSPTTVDWDKDGKPELLVGAEDGFLYYFGR